MLAAVAAELVWVAQGGGHQPRVTEHCIVRTCELEAGTHVQRGCCSSDFPSSRHTNQISLRKGTGSASNLKTRCRNREAEMKTG